VESVRRFKANGSQMTQMFTDKNFCVNLWNL
jgi:hypothetical protein